MLTNNPRTKNTLRLYHFSNTKLEDGTYKIAREYADDYAETYSVESISIENTPYLKVEVEKVKRTYRPVPDSGVPSDDIRDEQNNYRYIWKNDEIDYTDTYKRIDDTASAPNTPAYSYFRLSVAPELGTNWLPTNGLVVGGSNNQALGKDAFAAGSDNISNGSKAITLGDENYANYSAVAAGKKNKALNKYDVSLGYKNEVNAFDGFAAGESNVVKHRSSAAIGRYLKTHNDSEAVVGGYNIPLDELDKDDYGKPKGVALSVGAGWSEDTRRDAMTVYRDGTAKIRGHVHSAGTDITQTAIDAKAKAETATATANAALENKTILQLGKLPETGELNKLYINDQDEIWIYKIRKSLNIPANIIPWDGTKSIPTKGEGTETNPYQITTSQELAYAVSDNDNHYYQLMNDIYINDITNSDWKNGITQNWLSIQDGTKFNGHFDGNYYTIYGLYYNNPNDNTNENANGEVGCALFPKLGQYGTVTIKNIGMDYTYVNSSSVAGALIGNMTQTTFYVDNCYFGENVWLRGKATACIGAWGQDRGTISNCYSLANQESAKGTEDPFTECSMVLANYWSGKSTVTNCYSLNTPIIGRKSATTTIENCYCCVRLKTADTDAYGIKIPKEDMTGTNALSHMPGLKEFYINDYTYPHLKSFAEGWHKITPKF